MKKPTIYDLTERQWNQVRAALVFWNAVAENSRTHPCRHPTIEPMFDTYAPLSLEEVQELVDGTPELLYVSLSDIAKAIGRSRKLVSRRLEKAGVPLALQHGAVRLYRADGIAAIMEAPS